MSANRERLGEIRRSEEESSAWAVRVGEMRQRRRAIEKELVRMTGDFELATEVSTPGGASVSDLRSKRAVLLEELFRIRTGDVETERDRSSGRTGD